MRMKEQGDKATTLYALCNSAIDVNTYSEMRARMEAFTGVLAEVTCAHFCQVVAERELGRGNDDAFVSILMPRFPQGIKYLLKAERFLDVDEPLMYMWSPPPDYDDMEEPGEGEFIRDSQEDMNHKKCVAWFQYCKTFGTKVLTAWSCDIVVGCLENNLARYTELCGKWLAAWEAASTDSLPPSVEDIVEELNTFMVAVRAVVESTVWTAKSWAAFQKIFRPKRGDPKLDPVFLDMVYMLKGNPEWKEKEADAVRAASTELHGSEVALQVIQKRGSDFDNADFHKQTAEKLVEWKDAVRSTVWNPFVMSLYTWIQDQVTAAEASKIDDVEWEPSYVPVLQAMADSAAEGEVSVGAVDLLPTITVIASTACARFMRGAVAGWANNGCDWAVFAGDAISSARDRIVGHEDLAEEMGGVAHLQTVGLRAVEAYKEKLKEFESDCEPLKKAGENIVRVIGLVNEVAPEAFVDFVNAAAKVVSAAATTIAVGGKPKKGAADKLKKATESFTALGTQEDHSQFVLSFQQSPGYAMIDQKMKDIVSAATTSAKGDLLRLVDESEPMAGGAGEEGTWKSKLSDNAKLKDMLGFIDAQSVFVTEGDARSNIFDQVDKAGRVFIACSDVGSLVLRF